MYVVLDLSPYMYTSRYVCAKRNLSTHAILDDGMLSLEISDEEIYSSMDDAMHQDDGVHDASSDGVERKSHPSHANFSPFFI